MACKEECQFRMKVEDKIIDVSNIFTYTKLFTGLHNPEMKTKIKTHETMTKEDWDLEMDAEKMYTTIIDVDFNMREHHMQEHDALASKATSEYAKQKKFGKNRKPDRASSNSKPGSGSKKNSCQVCKKIGRHRAKECRSRCREPCGNKAYHMEGQCNQSRNAPMRKDYTSSQEEEEFDEDGSGYRCNVIHARIASTSHHEPSHKGGMEKKRPTPMPTAPAIISRKT